MNATSALAEIQILYDALPRLDCKGLCAKSCGPIGLSVLEARRIESAIGSKVQPLGADLTCPLLVAGRCSVYAIRPMLCRLWGMVEAMRCPWGCVPERWLTDSEARSAIDRVTALGRGERWWLPSQEAMELE